MTDTIAAIATGTGLSAIGIIRLSGPEAIDIADRVFRPISGEGMKSRRDRVLVYGALSDADGYNIDLCLCTVSRGPNSYTGEDTAELQCHGSPTVLRQGLEAIFAAGARQAGPGEFTKRAFLNGRMDLTQAEAVIDLIHAETVSTARNAAGQLGGAILKKAERIYGHLNDISAHYHAVIDYPDEDIEDFRLAEYADTLRESARELQALADGFGRGRVMNEGIPCVILGRPNAGKSSLLNALLGYERAIVTDIPGTTRDTIEEKCVLGGVLLRLIDTAGLRETGDTVESIGVERARAAAERAELALALVDPTEEEWPEEVLEAAQSAGRVILVYTKSDLKPMGGETLPGRGVRADKTVSLSSKTGEGIERICAAVSELFPEPDVPAGELLTNARQAEAVSRALASVTAAERAMQSGLTPDAVLTETEEAMSALGELTGRTVREDITRRIFERFCVGK